MGLVVPLIEACPNCASVRSAVARKLVVNSITARVTGVL